jgi:hypothetical protein
MKISEEQLKKYIEIQKKVRNVVLTLEEARKEASQLLIFVKTVAISSFNLKKQEESLKNN